ncbi:MAG: hypothetical protein A2W25_15210 [candidate division Zixibacteria bacterium RBG_16_53_22]|nr:MAG: hypothetical protein A2W25_15210 [candidate division Zixibacteria bacterium RBG_16_53_22]
MSLTPAADDPNRKVELQRKKQNQEAYDGNAQDPTPTAAQLTFQGSGLVADAEHVTQEDGAEEPQSGTDWTDYLVQSVGDLVPQLSDLDDTQLEEMREAELAGKARVTLLTAIEEELTQRQGA